MKIAHISDVHYSPKHLKWVHKAMTHAIDTAIKETCDIAVISGDLFDHGMSLHEPAVTACISDTLGLAMHVPLVILQGTFSHDRLGALDVFKGMPTTYPILVADEFGIWAFVDDRFEPVVNGSVYPNAECIFVCLPSLNKADPEVMEHGARAYVERLAAITRPITDAARAMGIPTVLVTHGTIQGSVTESKYAMVSPDHEFTEDMLYAFGCDITAIGHIHAHQKWERMMETQLTEHQTDWKQVIAYPGSLARLVHGDHSEKGMLIWDAKVGDASFEFIETPTRQLLEIDFDGPPVMDEITELAKKAGEDDAVRIRWMVDSDHAHTVDKDAIRKLFAHCETLKLEGTVLPIQRVRSPGISIIDSTTGKLEHWARTVGDADVIEKLTSRLDTLHSHEVEDITKSIMGEK